MKELETQTIIKPRSAADAARADSAVLRQLTALVNTPEFSTSESGDSGQFGPPPAGDMVLDPIPKSPSMIFHGDPNKDAVTYSAPIIRTRDVPQPASRVVFGDRVFTTGRLGVGKDTFLGLLGCKIHGFADPLYKIQALFFNSIDKSLPGARSFLQTVGQWGRGTVSDKYPLTPERAVFSAMVRALGAEQVDRSVDWSRYGVADSLWIDALLSRMGEQDFSTTKLGVSNVRFDNELTALKAAGFSHFHVMCSAKTLAARHIKSNITSAQATDISEQLAHNLDRSTMAAVKASPTGPKLRAVWMDEDAPAPSPRFITRAEILAA